MDGNAKIAKIADHDSNRCTTTIWLFGGGELFRSLLDAGLVDGVDAAITPVLLGGGVPLLPSPAERTR